MANPYEQIQQSKDRPKEVHWMDKTVDSLFNCAYDAQSKVLDPKATAMHAEKQLPKELDCGGLEAKTALYASVFDQNPAKKNAGAKAWQNIEDRLAA